MMQSEWSVGAPARTLVGWSGMALVLLTLWGCGSDGGPDDGPEGDPLVALSDEFDAPSSLSEWNWHHQTEEWPDLMDTVAIDTVGGAHLLRLVPQVSGWFGDWHGALMFKEVTGDFDVTTRVKPEGYDGLTPQTPWSLTGVMARKPRSEGEAGWLPDQEEWVFITAGVGVTPGVPMTETKTTVHSDSELSLIPVCAGWVELRMIRIGAVFTMLARCPGGAWEERASFERIDLPATLQVGLTAYSGFDQMTAEFGDDGADAFNHNGLPDGYPGLRSSIDYIRFQRPDPAGAGAASR